MPDNIALEFENTMRSYFGDEAYHIADEFNNKKSRKEWYRKSLKKMLRQLDAVDTSNRHKQILLSHCNRAIEKMRGKEVSETSLLYTFMKLSWTLLGYAHGRNICSVAYFRTPDQYMTEVISTGGDVIQDYHDRNNAVVHRQKIVNQLESEGLNDFQISLVLNTSEYQVKKLRKS